LIEKICREKNQGAILVFLPGWEEISNVNNQLQSLLFFKSNHLLLPLHSMMPTVNQKEVFDRPPPGVRKIILSTNIAETSITIDDVVYVIDCGKIKIKNYDPVLKISTLQPEWNSQANSHQRRGRAGRVQSGECYHLYTTYHESKLEPYQKPEILRTRLENMCLQIKLLKLGSIKEFLMRSMDAPDAETLDQSLIVLKQLRALTNSEELTPLGQHLARLPLDPQTGKMLLLGALFSCLDPITTIAASLDFKDAFTVPLGREKKANLRKRDLSRDSKSDHIMLVNAYNGWEEARKGGGQAESKYCWNNFLSKRTLRMLADMKSQFADLLYDAGFISSRDSTIAESNMNSGNQRIVKAIVCAGLYPNVAKISLSRIITTKDSRQACIHPKSVNFQQRDLGAEWLAYHLMMKTKKVYIFDCTPVSPFSLVFFGGQIGFQHSFQVLDITVDGWIRIRSDQRIAELVQKLRLKLDRILDEKFLNPAVLDWKNGSDDGKFMSAVRGLLTNDCQKLNSLKRTHP
jgi:ATP-dependent RNA helicase DHX36